MECWSAGMVVAAVLREVLWVEVFQERAELLKLQFGGLVLDGLLNDVGVRSTLQDVLFDIERGIFAQSKG